MPGIPLQSGIIYGPIFSRRLGRSLGINLSGSDRKICTFDCIYCQYGSASVVQPAPVREGIPTTGEVLSEVERAFKKPRTIEYMTFSGNGEPTLHPDFPEIVCEVLSLRDRLRPSAKLAILSNSSLVTDPMVVSALNLLDLPMMKFDGGNEQTFQAINRPHALINLKEIVKGLKEIPNLIIQSMLIDGKVSNIRGDPYEAWMSLLVALHPHEIHIYSSERTTADARVVCIDPRRLHNIARDIKDRYDLPVKAFC